MQGAAKIARCAAGMYDVERGRLLRSDPAGNLTTLDGPFSGPLHTELEDGASVWLERTDDPEPLDMLLMERFAAAVRAAITRGAQSRSLEDASGLVEIALAESTGEIDRLRALRMLGFRSDRDIRVLATLATETDSMDPYIGVLRRAGSVAQWAVVGETAVLLVSADARALSSAPFSRLGVGPALPPLRAASSFGCARVALRFAVERPHRDHIVYWDDLSGLALIAAHVPAHEVVGLPDVQAMIRLSSSARGRDMIASIESLLAEGSLRRAAAASHLHHSSTAARIRRAESLLGFGLDSPIGRARAVMALWLMRLVAGDVNHGLRLDAS
ncbi:helix-turn-helix domain-containing protein [Parafrankia sp. FMc2]